MYKVDCPRCSGTKGFWRSPRLNGRIYRSYSRCNRCAGKGYRTVKTNPVILAKLRYQYAFKSAERYAVKIEAEIAAEKAAIASMGIHPNKYKNDPRIGPFMQTRMNKYPDIADETYATLSQIDAGTIIPVVAVRLLENIGRTPNTTITA